MTECTTFVGITSISPSRTANPLRPTLNARAPVSIEEICSLMRLCAGSPSRPNSTGSLQVLPSVEGQDNLRDGQENPDVGEDAGQCEHVKVGPNEDLPKNSHYHGEYRG